ncbi:serine carboxypeptidase-like 18 [Bidens hawaiensis]|uniref:serine carboxypeptidase-like 18 n=1 Tax=Bidens hawaiensis TaxID=980011 RepID=UPI004049FA51
MFMYFVRNGSYVGVGKNEEIQLFYYFVESQNNPEEDPLICYIPGGPGTSALLGLLYGIGPLMINVDDGPTNATFSLNQDSWTKMASIIFLDIPAGTGFSYAKTKDASISSDSNVADQAHDFVRRFLIDHPKFLKNPLYIGGISYMGLLTPAITLKIYKGNERGDQPTLNIQGYILGSPLTNKFTDFNSRFEYAHRMALISDDIYEPAIENCNGNYLNIDSANFLCAQSLQRYKQCTDQININNILDTFCDESNLMMPYCQEYTFDAINIWANSDTAQLALNVSRGKIGKWELMNSTMHYSEGKKDTFCYAYDIFSSVIYHKKLTSKICRAVIFSGDHDMTFPYVGIEQWISSLNIRVEQPWEPYYVDGQVGGYEMTYAENDFSLTFATIKGAGHLVPVDKPKESMDVIKRWLASGTNSNNYIK